MENPIYKYQEEIIGIETPCPPESFFPKQKIAFRWVFDSMEDETNFSPQYFKNPKRFQSSSPNIKCQSLGLSFFNTEENARLRFQILASRMSKIAKEKLGKNLAKGNLFKEDGVSDLADHNGHFTFHPFESADLATQFEIISEL